jgi:transcription elongation factor SPT6
MRPFGSDNGGSVSVLAISHGRGGKDAVMAVFLDAKGHISAQSKFDGLGPTEDAQAFAAFVKEIKPDVVVIGGFTAETHRLRIEADGILKDNAAQEAGGDGMMQGLSGFAEHEYLDVLSRRQIPLIYVPDEVARLYMNSARAIQENPSWPPNARYSLGLARFVQDPLNEYCALGADLIAITYYPKLQALVSHSS